MIDNGHAIGNHGYDHDPMTRKGYKNSATADVKSDFIENHDYFTRLFEKNHDNFPGFSCARLPGDGRFMKRFVTMITNDIQIAHINWNIEFSTNGRMGHLAHKDWQGVKGVSCSKSDFPSGRDIILLHDLHWRGKELMLKQLLSKLQEKVIFKALDKIPPGHHAVKQAT